MLAYAAEEAEGFRHKHVGAEHLFMGLLREEETLAALVLREHGASLEKFRGGLRLAGSATGRDSDVPGAHWRAYAPAQHSYRLVGEDCSVLEHIRWQEGLLQRIPCIGEAIEVEQAGGKKRYRVLDVLWQVMEHGAELAHTGIVVLKVRVDGHTDGRD